MEQNEPSAQEMWLERCIWLGLYYWYNYVYSGREVLHSSFNVARHQTWMQALAGSARGEHWLLPW